MSNGTVIIGCFGVGEVACKNTIALPHYEQGIVTWAWRHPDGLSAAKTAKVQAQLEKCARKMQKIISKATGGEPYEFDEDVNALPECGPAP